VSPAACSPVRCRCLLLLASLASLALVGCSPKEPLPMEVRESLANPEKGFADSPISKDAADLEEEATLAAVSDLDWISRSELPWSYAEIHYLRGRRIGYSLMTVAQSELFEFGQLKIERLDVIDRGADGAPIPPRQVKFESFEKPNGELSSFKFVSTVDGQVDLAIEGRVIFDQLDLSRRENSSKAKSQKVAWKKGTWGPLGIQFLLMQSPMQPGQTREAVIYLPQMAQFVPAKLVANDFEITALPGLPASELLSIDVAMGTAESGSLSRIWVDQQGVIQKTAALSGQQVVKIKVAVETVNRLADRSQFGQLLGQHVPVVGAIEYLMSNDPATIQVESIELDPYGHFLQDGRQLLRSISAGACQLTVGTEVRPVTEARATEPPSDAELESSAIVPSSNLLFTQIAQGIIGAEAELSTRQMAESLSAGWHQTWKGRPQGEEIGSTLIAARTTSGGPVECASVLAALLRNQGIPSRLVGGLLVEPTSATAGFHVWTQYWTGDQWLNLDAHTGVPVGQRHLAMVATPASGENPYHLWLPTLKVIRELSELNVIMAP
jgi:hypothetical protein